MSEENVSPADNQILVFTNNALSSYVQQILVYNQDLTTYSQ